MKKKIITICLFLVIALSLIIIASNKSNNTPVSTNYLSLSESSNSGDDNVEELIIENVINQNTSFSNTNKIDYSKIKAVYASGWVAGNDTKRKEMIEAIIKHGFNAVVVDIKDEAGHLSYNSKIQTAIDISASQNMIRDIEAVIKEFHENGIYVIGRIVTFKDPTYAKAIKEISYQRQDGSYWTDKSGNYWPNPYNKQSWDYPINLAKEAIEFGFDEIQFDYIRFPSSEGRIKEIAYGFDSNTTTKSQIINQFLTKVMDDLADYKVKVSADVFGITTKKDGDFENIGQDYKAIANIVDIICPMVYPSHYGRGEYGIVRPDLDPYKIIFGSIYDAQKRVSGETNYAIIRPYLQDFTASWLGRGNYQVYGNEAVSEQIKACYDLGVYSFTLWDPSDQYCYEALTTIENNNEP